MTFNVAGSHTRYAYPVVGERLPLWLAPLLMVLGLAGSFYLAYAWVYPKIVPERPAAQIAVEQHTLPAPSVSANKGAVAQLRVAESVAHSEPSKTAGRENSAADKPPLTGACPALPFLFFKRDAMSPTTAPLKEKLALLKNWLAQHPGTKIIIEGYTDGHGSDEINLVYSYRRAKVAEAMMLKAGIPLNQLVIKAYGKQELLPNEPEDSEKNRRVTLRTDSAHDCINTLFDGILK
jgi:outer membrane protein OmpA-like peptidoglycan-associated protein